MTHLVDPLGFAALTGETAVVTGASSGIGAEVARTLGGLGLHVVLVGRDAERTAAVQAEIRRSGGSATSLTIDVTDDEAPSSILAAALSVNAEVSILVHCAGVFHSAPFLDTPTQDLDRAYQINVRAPYMLTRTFAPHMTSHSSVVFVGSNLSQFALPGTVAYSATKGAVEAMARTLSIELVPRGIHVNVVSPGTIRTPMTSAMTTDPSSMASEERRTPVGRIGEPNEVAMAVAYLCSPSSRFLVGSNILIDGGVCAG